MKISKKLTSFDLQQFVFEEELFFRNLRYVNFDGKESCFVSLLMLEERKYQFHFDAYTKEKRNYSNRIFLLLSASVKISSSTYDKKKNFNHWILCLVFLKNSQRRHVSFQNISPKEEKLHRFSINSSKKNLSTSMPCLRKSQRRIPKAWNWGESPNEDTLLYRKLSCIGIEH